MVVFRKSGITIRSILYLFLPVVCLSVAFLPKTYAGDFLLIANDSVPVESLSAIEIKNMFTGKIKLWENSDKIVIAYSSQRDTQVFLLKNYIRKTPQQFINYWRNLVFTGKTSTFPKYFDDEKKMTDFIASTKGAIGFVAQRELVGGVKIVKVE